MEKKIKNTVLQIFEGDITTLKVDAITNAANNRLWMGAGVAGAIKKKGGKEIEDEAVKKGPIKVGDAIETTAGKLQAKYVIHAAVMGQDLKTDEKKIRDATRNTLRLAKKLNLKSVALPAFGTGVGGFSLSRCANIMIDEVKKFVQENKELELIIFATYGKEAYEAFCEELQKIHI